MHGHTYMHTHPCTLPRDAAAAPDLGTLAGWLGRAVGQR
jgi:hypothetical protein